MMFSNSEVGILHPIFATLWLSTRCGNRSSRFFTSRHLCFRLFLAAKKMPPISPSFCTVLCFARETVSSVSGFFVWGFDLQQGGTFLYVQGFPASLKSDSQTCQTEAPPGLEVKFIWECSGVAVVDIRATPGVCPGVTLTIRTSTIINYHGINYHHFRVYIYIYAVIILISGQILVTSRDVGPAKLVVIVSQTDSLL